jgi:hypothetical protein
MSNCERPAQSAIHESPPRMATSTAHRSTSPSRRARLTGAVVVLLILAVLAAIGVLRRMHAHTVLAQRTYDLAAPTVIRWLRHGRARPWILLCCPAT